MKAGPSAAFVPAPGASARGQGTPGGGRWDFLAPGWKPHLVLIVLAVVIWWVANQRIEQRDTWENRVKLEVTLDPEDEELLRDYTILEQPRVVPLLRVRGPREELTRYQDMLDRGQGRAIYAHTISASRLRNAAVDDQYRVVLDDITLGMFDGPLHISPPPEVAVEFADVEQAVRVVLEKRLEREAEFDAAAILAPAEYSLQIAPRQPLKARGAWSKLKPAVNLATGKAVFKFVTLDLGKELAEQLKDPARHAELTSTPMLRELSVVPVEGVHLLAPDGAVVSLVPVTVSIIPRISFVLVEARMPVDVLLPHWMIAKHVSIEPLDRIRDFPVALLIDAGKRANFTSDNVRCSLDLRDVTQESLGVGGAIGGIPLRLHVNREHLPYRLPDGARPEEQYHLFNLTITWKD